MNVPRLSPSGLLQRAGAAATGTRDFLRASSTTGRNAAELLRYGGLQVDPETSPFDVVHTHPTYKLRHYFPAEAPEGLPALVLVPPLMMMADLYDVAPRSSSVRAVHDQGIDVWVVDFGRPETEAGGLERTIADHVLAVSDAVDQVREATGRDVVLGGYSQGGMFVYQAAAYRRNAGIDSIVTFGAPVDFSAAPLPIPLSFDAFTKISQTLLDSGLLEHLSLPSWFNRSATRMLDPVKTAQFRLQYYRQLHDREKLLPGEQQRIFLDREGWTAYSGPAFAELLRHVMITNRMMQGGLVIGDRTVTLADLELPILTVLGEIDKEGHPASVRSIRQAAPRAEIYEYSMHTGHFGIVAGGGARKRTWPRVAEWVRWRAGEGERPEAAVPAAEVTPTSGWQPGDTQQRVQTAIDLGIGAIGTTYGTASNAVKLVNSLARDSAQHLPLLNRIGALRPDTAISLGLLLDEAARRSPDGEALLFGDRVVRQAELKGRVDNVVKGLVSVGVRAGDRVGIVMTGRPSALTVLAAVSRVGATAVLLRPDSDIDAEARLGRVDVVVADPDNTPAEHPLPGVRWCVLGGGSEERVLPSYAVDMERIDPDRVAMPAWYQPNPTRAADVAFILFTGRGAGLKARTITNRRWALSALGTASAAGLGPTHTVYSVSPLYHSSALLMAVGGAIASGARIALASDTTPATFWDEVRRYGATHVSYTWTSLRAITDGPPNPAEQGHPIRMFMGSGMPPGLWRRVTERFAPAQVLEFYASTEGEAILANVAGTKVGAAGRPVPGTARVKVIAFDPATGRPTFGADGLARECGTDEPGLLVARADVFTKGEHVLRGLFNPSDAWQSTGDVFVRDADGDLWLRDSVDALIRDGDILVAPSRITRALSRIPRVDLVTTFGVMDGDREVVGAAVTVFPGADLTAWDLSHALAAIPVEKWPRFVRVVDEIPLTPWSRPVGGPIAELGVPAPGPRVALLDEQRRAYDCDADVPTTASTTTSTSTKGPS